MTQIKLTSYIRFCPYYYYVISVLITILFPKKKMTEFQPLTFLAIICAFTWTSVFIYTTISTGGTINIYLTFRMST